MYLNIENSKTTIMLVLNYVLCNTYVRICNLPFEQSTDPIVVVTLEYFNKRIPGIGTTIRWRRLPDNERAPSAQDSRRRRKALCLRILPLVVIARTNMGIQFSCDETSFVVIPFVIHQIINVYGRFSKCDFSKIDFFAFPNMLKFKTTIVLELRQSLRYLSDVLSVSLLGLSAKIKVILENLPSMTLACCPFSLYRY
ncbi:hypothetical protein QTP88_018976 [Uroleucon formosanum]